jgi:hypothetical protein
MAIPTAANIATKELVSTQSIPTAATKTRAFRIFFDKLTRKASTVGSIFLAVSILSIIFPIRFAILKPIKRTISAPITFGK